MINKLNDILSAPCEVAIEITGRCNLRCKYCFSGNTNIDIAFPKLKNIFDQIDEMDVFEVCITGGEPFIRNDIMEILDYIRNKDFITLIVTNGTLLTKKRIKKLDEIGLINSLQISIDSFNEDVNNSIRGAYTNVISVLKEIKRNSSSLPTIGVVIHNQNYKNICNSLKELSEYCTAFHFMNIQASNIALENKEYLFLDTKTIAETWKEIEVFSKDNKINVDINDNDLKEKENARFTGCTAGKTKLVIKPNLEVIPCDMTRDIILGNLESHTIKEIWNSNKRKEISNRPVEPCYELNKKWYLEQPIES